MSSSKIELVGLRLRIAGREVERAREQRREKDAGEWERRYHETLAELQRVFESSRTPSARTRRRMRR